MFAYKPWKANIVQVKKCHFKICVKECPKDNWFSETVLNNQSINDWEDVQKQLLCTSKEYARSITSLAELKEAIKNENCAPYYLKSIPVNSVCLPTIHKTINGTLCISDNSTFGKICLPDLTSKIGTKVPLDLVENGSNSVRAYFYTFFQILQEVRQDLVRCWHLVAILLCASVLTCLFFIIILGVLAKLMVWLTFLIIIILLCWCTLLSYVKYKSFDNPVLGINQEGPMKQEDTTNLIKTGFWLYDRLQELAATREFWSILTITCGVVTVAFIVLIIFLRKRINLAILIVREGSKAINAIKTTLIFPAIPLILKLVIILWFLVIFGFLKTLGNSIYTIEGIQNDTDCLCTGVTYKENIWCLPHQFNDHCYSKMNGINSSCVTAVCKFSEQRTPKLMLSLHAYNFYGLLWSLYFVSGLGRMILSYCFALWYWTLHKSNIPYFTLLTSFYITIRYHLGTVAVGSFLISALSFLRSCLEYLHRTLKKHDNLLSQCAFWSLRCFFWILQKVLTFISENAYTMCAIYGEGFWASANSAITLLLRNIVRVAVLDKVVDFLILMGKVGITFGMGLIAHYVFNTVPLCYPWVPIALVVIVTWIIASTFFSVYTVAVDTLFLCFLKDGEINDGSQEKPYYMSSNLKYVLNKNLHRKKKRITPH